MLRITQFLQIGFIWTSWEFLFCEKVETSCKKREEKEKKGALQSLDTLQKMLRMLDILIFTQEGWDMLVQWNVDTDWLSKRKLGRLSWINKKYVTNTGKLRKIKREIEEKKRNTTTLEKNSKDLHYRTP